MFNTHYTQPSSEERRAVLEESCGVEKIIREKERAQITGISRTRWWELEKSGAVPERISLGTRSVGWRLSDLLYWITRLTNTLA